MVRTKSLFVGYLTTFIDINYLFLYYCILLITYVTKFFVVSLDMAAYLPLTDVKKCEVNNNIK